jgi:hypothetical protein
MAGHTGGKKGIASFFLVPAQDIVQANGYSRRMFKQVEVREVSRQ